MKYDEFFRLFENEEYFESHEVLEELWIEATERTTKDHPAIVLLQFAVALLHWQRGNLRGSDMVFRSALDHLQRTKEQIEKIGVDSSRFEILIREAIVKVEREESYRKISIPLL